MRAGPLSILMSPLSLIARGVKKEDKTLAVGIQFMLLRVLGKEPLVQMLTVCVPGPGHRDERDPVPDFGVRWPMGKQMQPRSLQVGV